MADRYFDQPSQVLPDPYSSADPDGFFQRVTKGSQKCKMYADGTQQTTSAFCWFWLGMMTVAFIGNVGYCLRQGIDPKSQERTKWRYLLVAVIGLLVGGFNIYVFYNHCVRCNGWVGFFVTFLLTLAVSTLTYTIAPSNDK